MRYKERNYLTHIYRKDAHLVSDGFAESCLMLERNKPISRPTRLDQFLLYIT